jgi:sugar phosphate isomerase/epimerase
MHPDYKKSVKWRRWAESCLLFTINPSRKSISNLMIKTSLALSPTPAKFAPLLFAGSLDAGMQAAAELGFDGVELNLLDSERLDQDEIQKEVRDLKLEVAAFGTGQSYFEDNLSLADTQLDVQEKVRERLRGHIRFASKLGAKVILGSIRGKLDTRSEESREAGYRIAVEAVRELATYANQFGVLLVVEPINRYETNFLNTIQETLAFINAVGHPNVGLLADTFHMNIEEPIMNDSLRSGRALLRHVHFADSNRYAPGMGHIDFAELVRSLKEMGYNGYASGEIIPVPDSYVAAKRWMDTIYSMLVA